MRKFVLWLAIFVGAALTLGGCTDSPTQPDQQGAPDLAVPLLDEQTQGCVSGGVCVLPPMSSDPGDGACDPTVTECDDGGGDCLSDAPGTFDLEMGYTSSCGGGGTATGPGGDGGGPGADGGDGEDGSDCDPYIHPDCEKPLTATDTTTILTALRNHLRPQAQFTDTTAARACAQMEIWFRNAMGSGDVFRGGFDSDSTNDPNGEHYGSYDPTTSNIHFDPWGLDGAAAGNAADLLEVAITALHEGAHWGGKLHPTAPTFDSLGRDYYTDEPFKFLNPGPNSCIPR
jgi:hypothetical protein